MPTIDDLTLARELAGRINTTGGDRWMNRHPALSIVPGVKSYARRTVL